MKPGYIFTLLMVATFCLAAHADAGILDPNNGTSHGYPSTQKYDDSPGDAKGIYFDEKRIDKVSGIHEPNDGQTTGYPDARIRVEKAGDAKPIRFDTGRVQYPSEYRDPADAHPMEVPDRNKEDDEQAILPPKGVCPLTYERGLFNSYNRQVRKNYLTAFRPGKGHTVIQTTQRDEAIPARLGGGFVLVDTWTEKENGWSAKVFIPAGFACGGQEYVVHQDDSLTDDCRVLAIGPGMVLIQAKDELAYLRSSAVDPISWRMVWDSGIEVEFEASQPQMKAEKSSKKNKSQKKKKRKKRKRRSNRKKKSR